jgi:hypothetical protein
MKGDYSDRVARIEWLGRGEYLSIWSVGEVHFIVFTELLGPFDMHSWKVGRSSIEVQTSQHQQ